jgi:biotin operon repressor
MIKSSTSNYESQDRRSLIKNISSKMKNLAIKGAGLSKWEADVLVEVIEEVYFTEPGLRELSEGQTKRNCIASSEGSGKELKDCQLVTVVLTLLDKHDALELSSKTNQGRSIEMRQRRLMRMASEAKDQGGLLSQEDLSELLMCDVRTIRRDVQALKKKGIVIPTRGTIKDIGPGVTHREIAIRLWLEGKEPVAIKNHINHHIKSVENYLEKFKRVVYLRRKGFNDFEAALTIGISKNAVSVYSELYNQYKNKKLFKFRLDEIELIGSEYYSAQDEKKRIPQLSTSIKKEQRMP